jgi:hypothetical protein
MSETAMHCTEHDLRTLLGAFLRARSRSAKDLARQIGCDPRAAEGYRAGRYWPQARHWLGIVAAFGRDVTEAVFHPDAATERLAREVRELEQQLDAKRQAAADAARTAARLAALRDRAEDRTAELTPRR